MVTAVDTSVLIDVFAADKRFGPASRDALRRCLREGAVVASDVVWAEVLAGFAEPELGEQALRKLGIKFVPMDQAAATAAAAGWRAYREAGGARARVIADFLIGAHASTAAERLLTRDRGFYRAHFGSLELVEPASTAGTTERDDTI